MSAGHLTMKAVGSLALIAGLLLAAAALGARGEGSAAERADVRVRVSIPATNTGTGTVTGPGFVCPGDCTEFVAPGSSVTLDGNPETGSDLAWSGDCEGTPPESSCTLTPTANVFVIAIFTATGPGPGPGDDKAPKTTITKAPKKKVKTKKSKAKVRLEFKSSEAGSTFECRLDKDSFEDCKSPVELKVGLGKHTVDVRATDKAENVEETPAQAAFKVVKKKKR